ncbi:methyltransferase domain-containing protein [Jiangella alkaliphila]|uniref:Protein-L-isoaspartate O-methyltransferase n=1 Tax=Jiangella alkaliphila TaxID=419479 RepID=A0A1H2LJQ8_9ACTN|nr:methyltransferase domain-containing protein [Jiangella alkaliphila]SDU81082.1 methyltransferase, ATP-grasp peptide maturase system [Jiangella alkaliphila]
MTAVVAEEDWRPRAVQLADELVRSGSLTDQAWRDVFAAVPRHVFVPHFARTELTPNGTKYTLVNGDDPDQRESWLRAAYSDTTLLTQVDGQPVEEAFATASGYGRHTSSATAPGLMGWMLEDLGVRDGDDVLELGAGTGYNAALLSVRLGDQHVTSVDIDAQLVETARWRLAEVGQRPTVEVGDGRSGWLRRAPYDRVIATFALPYVPESWIDQTSHGGAILTNVSGSVGGAMLLAEVTGPGTATGTFVSRWAGFMPSRHQPLTRPDSAADYVAGHTMLAADALDDRAFAFLAQLHLPGARVYHAVRDDGRRLRGLLAPDGSWAEVYEPDPAGECAVEQGGPQRLWDVVETAHHLWIDAGRPDWTSYGFHAEPGRQTVTLGDHSGWELTDGTGVRRPERPS